MKDKSVALALVLTFFFGPLGLFYVSVWGAVALVVLAAAGVVPTMGFVLIFVWPASMVWAAIGASRQHNAFLSGPGQTSTDLPDGTAAETASGSALNN
jgi:energy-coupling factor transporter transmembrane protein EcfT